MSGPHGHESARFVEYRPKTVQSLLGSFPLQRAYYHCRSCGAGTVPWDDAPGLSRRALTPGAREVACLAGAVDSFGEAADVVLRELSGLRASGSTVQRASEEAGRDLGARLAAGATFGGAEPWAWHKDAEGKTCAYVALDLTGLGMQGPGGAAAEGRMVAVGRVSNPVPEDPARYARPGARAPHFQARYVAGLGGQASLGAPLRKQAARVGMDEAERWLALSDAGAGVEDWLRTNFGRVEAVIVDFQHVAEHPGDLGRALHPVDEPARGEWLDQWCHRLKHEGGAAVLDALRAPPLDGRSEAAREVHGEVVGDFEDHVHRMDYPTYLAKGWAIGSGPIEAACKTVIGKRMKGGGMRWGADGADEMSHLRALFASGEKRWDAYWRPNRN